MTRIHVFHKVANVLVYLFFLSATVYSLTGKSEPAGVFAQYETYFDPAPWVFLVWTVIHLLLGGFVIYQWFEPAHEQVIHGVGWHFVISSLLNALWYSLLENNRNILAFIVTLLLVSSVSFVFYNLATEFPTTTWWDKLFIHAPFSLWHGWTVFLAVVNAFVAFTHVDKDQDGNVLEPNAFIAVLVYIALAFLTLTVVSYVEYKHKKGDVTSALVIAFGLWAIFDEQRVPVVHWGALVAAIISTLYPAKPYVFKLFGARTTEAAPLLG